jgi:predicted metal-dependent hydrolase
MRIILFAGINNSSYLGRLKMKIRKFACPKQSQMNLCSDNYMESWYISYCLLVADAERFIIQTCQKFFIDIQNPQLKENMRMCFMQETQHAITHEAFFKQIAQEHLGLRLWIHLSQILNYKIFNPFLPLRLKLAVSGAMEQLNTAIAYGGLTRSVPKKTSETFFFQMLYWHFVEEIEHREVVFDLMNEVKLGQGYRWAGMAFTLFSFTLWISLGALLVPGRRTRWRSLKETLFSGDSILAEMWRASCRFVSPNYHPSQENIPSEFQTFQLALQLPEVRTQI